ncbi:hypothetical protein [Pantoea ananatis]|uniref:hypothetical protein n=1 Tax=Pantoea ananas TaxID=553 RepID=UPI0025CAD036|nr:hypothetical protein [Pantoea ananatis]MDN4130035.1 hypothetical protein [Pantoea ananatis]MDN4153253.1 hypothetical protein [Pantoea ananatis]
MPYYVVRELELLKSFKRNKPSVGISTLKIFILICLKSERDDEGGYSASLTYDQITQYCSLSRRLTSEGLRYLELHNIIEVYGDRKKRYILKNCRKEDKNLVTCRFHSKQGYWCKIPFGSFIDEGGRISAFEAMNNRNVVELNALKLYLYVMMVRSGGKAYTAVTIRTMKAKLGISYQEIIVAISFLNSVGLMDKVNYGSNAIGNYDERFAMKFLVSGWECLEWKPTYMSNDKDDEFWKNSLLEDFF